MRSLTDRGWRHYAQMLAGVALAVSGTGPVIVTSDGDAADAAACE